MKYARIERERRFLLAALPQGVAERPFLRITDHYITDTRLRLRRMEDASGNPAALKFTQKSSDPGGDSTHTIITNMYLNETEFELLSGLGGNRITKRRYPYQNDGRRFSIDVFEDRLSGLILAEIECATDEQLHGIPAPPFAVRDVTDDIFFTGGQLATLSKEKFQVGLRQRLDS